MKMYYRHIDVLTGEIRETSDFYQLSKWSKEEGVALSQVCILGEWYDISNACERFNERLVSRLQKLLQK